MVHDGFSAEAQRKMTRPETYHDAVTVALDDTTHLGQLPFSALEISTRNVPPEYLGRQIKLAIAGVIEGKGGLGSLIGPDGNITVVTFADNSRRVDQIVELVDGQKESFAHNIRHIPLLKK